MDNLNEYRKRFQTLMESTMGDVKPLINEDNGGTQKSNVNNEDSVAEFLTFLGKNKWTISIAGQSATKTFVINTNSGKIPLDMMLRYDDSIPHSPLFQIIPTSSTTYSSNNPIPNMGKSVGGVTIGDPSSFDDMKLDLDTQINDYLFKVKTPPNVPTSDSKGSKGIFFRD
jgi:hypothetical protein